MTYQGTLLSMIAVSLLLATPPASAQTYAVLHSFNGTDGANPRAGLLQATDGNLYGMTSYGGAYGYGSVFNITPDGTLTTIYSFCQQNGFCLDGSNPSASLIQASDGNFYGTTTNGGGDMHLYGTVFKITPSGTLTTLHSFDCISGEGSYPSAGLVQASNGNFYGTTASGCANSYGIVFQITPSGTLTVLHSFDKTDGANPEAGLIQAYGKLYGTTSSGGSHSNGTVFQITLSGTLTTLHNFCSKTKCADGAVPQAGLVQAGNGNFYGTTSEGGSSTNCPAGCGTVFEITPSGTLTTLHSFDGTDGDHSYAGLVQATDGNLYGTTEVLGAGGDGTIFGITPSGTLTTQHSFGGADGSSPFAAPIQATDGNLYGTTDLGGANNSGTVYRLSEGLKPFLAVTPTSGKEGANIDIVGQGFNNPSVVKFGGTTATGVVVSSTTSITATVPAGAMTGSVTVTTGTATLTSAKIFKVLPTIASFNPTSGPVGTSVAIDGTGLMQTTAVKFGSVTATNVTVNSDTQVTAEVPTGATTGRITVTTKGGSVVSTTNFTVN